MRKIRETLRLHFELKLGQRQIARSINVSQSTVHEYLARFRSAHLSWPLPAEMTDTDLETALFPDIDVAREVWERPSLDLAEIHSELQAHKHTTLMLLWEEYRAANPNGYSYSRFCYHYQQWRQSQELVMRQEHVAGEKMFVDWAGAKIPVYDPQSGAIHEASLFVAVLGASSYTFAQARWTEGMEDWIAAHVDAFEFFQGVPQLVVPDNTKTGVTRPCRYDPDLNPTYQELAAHYGVGVLPARVRKPRDKAKVEAGVQVAQRWVVAALRHRRFTSLGALNEAVRELVRKLNHRPFRKRAGCRHRLFLETDFGAMRPLPAERFEVAVWSKATVNIDYHVQVGHSFYSVPWKLARQTVEIRATASAIEVFHRGLRVASHQRSRKEHAAITIPEHRPKAHQAHLEWPPSRLVQWACSAGPNTARLFEQILESKPHPEMGYRSCLGLLRLGQKYSIARLEKACERALLTGACTYRSIKSMLQSGIETQQIAEPDRAHGLTDHNNIRGSEYFQ